MRFSSSISFALPTIILSAYTLATPVDPYAFDVNTVFIQAIIPDPSFNRMSPPASVDRAEGERTPRTISIRKIPMTVDDKEQDLSLLIQEDPEGIRDLGDEIARSGQILFQGGLEVYGVALLYHPFDTRCFALPFDSSGNAREEEGAGARGREGGFDTVEDEIFGEVADEYEEEEVEEERYRSGAIAQSFRRGTRLLPFTVEEDTVRIAGIVCVRSFPTIPEREREPED